ncbi:unnamed protein product [Penicillium camemberti]|uniref:Str. FM013 n=1 Tax=Penicillium camemberti (strain FM 013) TaxID=1429867 RepID=A0A0G4PCN6_PENC3|nr:unnamed protein product [Penicillium camemberti]
MQRVVSIFMGRYSFSVPGSGKLVPGIQVCVPGGFWAPRNTRPVPREVHSAPRRRLRGINLYTTIIYPFPELHPTHRW